MPVTKFPHLSPEMNDGRITVAPGVKLSYVDRGRGAPIVFVPGWTFTKEVFEKQISEFSRKYRVISYDPRSQGASATTAEGNDYLTHAQDLAALLDGLQVRNPVLVGWSAGAHATLGFIKLRGPEAVAAHVVIDMPPKCMSYETEAWIEGTLEEISAVHTLYLRDGKGHADYIKLYAETVMVQRNLLPEELNWIVGLATKTKPLVAAQLFASCMFQDNNAAAVAVAKARPTLYFVAQHWAAKAVAHLKYLLPETKYVVFGGHMMFWEHPEAFNRVLDEFIQRSSTYGVPDEAV
jgi:pimeloyl-ACP methyl ester carboxylesterase